MNATRSATRWEYRLWFTTDDPSGDWFHRQLNDLGEHGWEMVTRQSTPSGQVFYFKRKSRHEDRGDDCRPDRDR